MSQQGNRAVGTTPVGQMEGAGVAGAPPVPAERSIERGWITPVVIKPGLF